MFMDNDNAFHGRQTSPRFIGSLKFTMFEGTVNTTRQLLDLPDGLHHILVASGGRPSVDGVGNDVHGYP